MKKSATAWVAIASILLLSVSAFADGDRGNRGHDRQFGGPGFGMPSPLLRIERMADHLALDDLQREQLQNIVAAAKPEMKALREQLRANYDALKNIDVSDPNVQNLATSNGELATSGTLLIMRVRSEIRAVLTDEQLAKLAESRERRKERSGRRKPQS